MIDKDTCSHCQRGFTMPEVLATVVLLALALGPALTAMYGAIQSTDANAVATTNDYRLLEKIEQVLALPFDSVAAAASGAGTASSYSDLVGTADRRLVFIANYDVDNADTDNDPFTGTESDMLWVQVQIEESAHTLEALKGKP